MTLATNIFKGIAIVGLGALTLVGCSKQVDSAVYQGEPIPEEPTSTPYFAALPMYSESGMAMTNGDFDGDGDLDLIVGAHRRGLTGETGALYFFENDGRGNFSLKRQAVNDPENYQ